MAPGDMIRFETSGHTGSGKVWLRSESQLRAEASLIRTLIVGKIDEVVCFAPPQHIFGKLFGAVLPQLLGIPVQHMHHNPFAAPVLRPHRRVLFVCLPSTWTLLERLTLEINRLAAAVLLHGTGPTTSATERTMANLDEGRTRAAEIFGSTESGGIGYRNLALDERGAVWKLLPDVDLLEDPEGGSFGPGTRRLHVKSPRLAIPENFIGPVNSLMLDDVVRLCGQRQFEFVGRASRLLKVNGKRCNLDEVERWAGENIGVQAACAPVTDEIRGESYELFYKTDGVNRVEDVWRQLARLDSALPPPRRVHAVENLPGTDTGKIRIWALKPE